MTAMSLPVVTTPFLTNDESRESLQIRVHGGEARPTLVYLPGLHGDWTLVTSFRKAIGNRATFVEFTNPRTCTWSLADYAVAIEDSLREHKIDHGWLLGESFGSQIVWALVEREQFHVDGIVLAGGFVRHPMRWAARCLESISGGIPLSWLTRIMFGYAKVARFRYRMAPETMAGIDEFIARRTELDRQAAKHRLHLVAQSDPRNLLRNLKVPVYAISGFLDPIVPWCFVRPWLRHHAPALREYRIIGSADHNVLGTAPKEAARQVMQWIRSTSEAQSPS